MPIFLVIALALRLLPLLRRTIFMVFAGVGIGIVGIATDIVMDDATEHRRTNASGRNEERRTKADRSGQGTGLQNSLFAP